MPVMKLAYTLVELLDEFNWQWVGVHVVGRVFVVAVIIISRWQILFCKPLPLGWSLSAGLTVFLDVFLLVSLLLLFFFVFLEVLL